MTTNPREPALADVPAGQANPIHENRPRLHLTPPFGWINDPNGLFLHGDRLHVTYQHNPLAPEWGRMHWGHADSADLLTWRHRPLALAPGSGPDADGCWSGGIVPFDDAALAFYTGVVVEGDLRRQVVGRATSRDPDRLAWTVDPDPIIATPPDQIAPDLFRDPYVLRDGDGWQMLVGAGSIDGHGAVVRYRSDDLDRWDYDRVILSSAELDPALGADGPMWECPQLLRFGDEDVLIVSIVDRTPGVRPSHVMAFRGRLEPDGFRVDHAQQLGMGPDFYAPAACRLPDGRWLLLGWIPEDPPAASSDRDWAGSLTFPRIVDVRPGGPLSLSLATEVAAARTRPDRHGPLLLTDAAMPGDGRAAMDAAWPPLPEGPFELALQIDPVGDAEAVVELRDHGAEPLARITWRPSGRLLTIARRGIVRCAGRSSMSGVELPERDGRCLALRVIVDGSVLEMEANGHVMATARLPGHASAVRRVRIAANGGTVRMPGLDVIPLVAPDAPKAGG